MFEELFSRKRQSKTTERALPKEIDAVQKVSGGGKRSRHTSMSVDSYILTLRVVVTSVVLLGVGIIGVAAYGLVSDFITYSAGAPVDSSSVQRPAAEPGE